MGVDKLGGYFFLVILNKLIYGGNWWIKYIWVRNGDIYGERRGEGRGGREDYIGIIWVFRFSFDLVFIFGFELIFFFNVYNFESFFL